MSIRVEHNLAAGLDGFYRRTTAGEPLGPPPALPKNLAIYDLDAVQEEFLDTAQADAEKPPSE